MMTILKTYVGATQRTPCLETARVMGFRNIGVNVSESLTKAMKLLFTGGKIEEIDGKLRIVKQ